MLEPVYQEIEVLKSPRENILHFVTVTTYGKKKSWKIKLNLWKKTS